MLKTTQLRERKGWLNKWSLFADERKGLIRINRCGLFAGLIYYQMR
jgi:hypothetical protein